MCIMCLSVCVWGGGGGTVPEKLFFLPLTLTVG